MKYRVLFLKVATFVEYMSDNLLVIFNYQGDDHKAFEISYFLWRTSYNLLYKLFSSINKQLKVKYQVQTIPKLKKSLSLTFLIILLAPDIRFMMEIQNNHHKKIDESLPWVEKYRPASLSDLISHEQILDTLKNFIKEGNLPNLLFYGPPGTGKTSTIKALAKQFYGQDYSKMVLQLNASDQRGIDVVRNQIKGFAANKTLTMKNNNLKLIILDEADMMTQPSQFALRRIIQKFSSNVRFCLISNYVSRVIPALQSRCTRFKFKQIGLDAAIGRINEICDYERISITTQGIKAVFALCQGDMRRVVNMLQSLSMIARDKQQIDQEQIYNFTGNPSPKNIQKYMDILFTSSVSQAMQNLGNQFKNEGISMLTIVKQIFYKVLTLKMTESQKAFIVSRLGELEYRLSIGANQNLCLGALVGAFTQIRDRIDEQ